MSSNSIVDGYPNLVANFHVISREPAWDTVMTQIAVQMLDEGAICR